MDVIIVTSALLNLGYFLIAVGAIMGVLRVLDKISSHKFTDSLAILQSNPVGLGLYLGLRFLGVCVLAAGFLK